MTSVAVAVVNLNTVLGPLELFCKSNVEEFGSLGWKLFGPNTLETNWAILMGA